MIVIGLGTGRCGTKSLSRLLNSQKDALVFHEMNPSKMSWKDGWEGIKENVRAFQDCASKGALNQLDLEMTPNQQLREDYHGSPSPDLIGEIAFYYLPYVERLLDHDPQIKFICLRREKNKTVESYLKKTSVKRRHRYLGLFGVTQIVDRNHWINHDGIQWKTDAIWDKCYPKYTAKTKREALDLYWEDYYSEASRLQNVYADRFKIVELDDLNQEAGQQSILAFCNIPDDQRILDIGLKHNVSGS